MDYRSLSKHNIHLIGKYVSDNQGWIEGALKSVENFLGLQGTLN